MKVLIKNAIIVNSSSPFNGQSKDILIENGIISRIENEITEPDAQHISSDHLHISTGWMDVFADFCDPGFEHKESLETGTAAAAAGGFTEVMLVPGTNPVVDNKSQVRYLIQKAAMLPVTIHPIGAITKNTEGKVLSEMYDMANSGAIAFSDGFHSVQSSGIILKALQYIKAGKAIIIQLPEDMNIGSKGLMNEGIVSTKMGLPGKPAIAEELMIARDIELVKYTGSSIHFTGISTAASVQLIAKAKSNGLSVTCSVTPYHLFFTDSDLEGYDTNLKVNPPIRTVSDREALLKGVLDGTIDCIASHHRPQDYDNKICEFEYAQNGMTGLETLFGVMLTVGIPLNTFITMQSEKSRSVFGIAIPKLETGAVANLTMFDPNTEYVVEESALISKSKNNGFVGRKLKGRTIGIINAEKVFLK